MKRLFLLIAVCMVGMVNALAGFTVVPPEESETGSYVLTFKETAAEGETLYDWSDISEGGSLSFLSKATSLTIVTEEGCPLDDDDTTQIMGSNGNYGFTPTLFPKLEELDMGDAALADNSYLMKMVYAKPTGDPNIKGLQNLKYFVFPKTTTTIPTGVFNGNTTLEEIILLENDQLTEIPGGAFQGCTRLAHVRIPDGITNIGENAFEHCAFEAIFLPNSLTTIGVNAFGKCPNLKSITIPASVTSIGTSAFQENTSMTDVYVLGSNVTIQHGAFNQNETFNFKYTENGDVDYTDWNTDKTASEGATPHPLRLHIPEDAYNNYVNPYQRALNDPDMKDEWLDDFNNHQDDIRGILSKYEGINPGNGIWYFQPNGGEACYVKMDGKRYFRDGDGKFNYDNGLYGAYGPYAGWRNFMLAATDVSKKTWPDTRIVESRWYSAVFPFDMSYDQLIAAYGYGTDVREFTYVNEHTVDGKKKRTVTFNTEINTTRQGRRILYRGTGDSYIEKGVPYMIHPGVRVEVITTSDGKFGRTIAGVDVDDANDEVANGTPLTVTRSLVDGDNSFDPIEGTTYTFQGSYKDVTLPANTFYLGYEKDKWPLAFYVTTADIDKGWTAFTSVVQKTGGGDPALAKGTMDFDFIELPIIKEDFGITTRIESVAPKTGRMELQKVYNLSGQVVRENNDSLEGLSKGVYVVNGKKIVVR